MEIEIYFGIYFNSIHSGTSLAELQLRVRFVSTGYVDSSSLCASTKPSLVPRPPLFFVLWFAFSIIHGSGRAQKTGKAWEHLSRE